MNNLKLNKDNLLRLDKVFYINFKGKKVKKDTVFFSFWIKNRKTKKIKQIKILEQDLSFHIKDNILYIQDEDIFSNKIESFFIEKEKVEKKVLANIPLEKIEAPLVPTFIPDLSLYEIEKEGVNRYLFDNISFLADYEKKIIIKDRKKILLTLLTEKSNSNLNLYYQKIFRPINHNFSLILELDFCNLKSINDSNSYIDQSTNIKIRFNDKIKYFKYLGNKKHHNEIIFIRTKEERELTKENDIANYLKGIDSTEVFLFKTRGHKELMLGALDLGLFFLLNTDIIDEVFVGNKKANKELLYFKPKKLENIIKEFSSFIDLFLEYINEDYIYEYEDMKKLDINIGTTIRGNVFEPYTKRKLQTYNTIFNNNIQNIEENFKTKIIPKNIT